MSEEQQETQVESVEEQAQVAEATEEVKEPVGEAKGTAVSGKPVMPEGVKAETLGNEYHYAKGDVVHVNGLEFIVKEVTGVGLVLARKDFK